MTLPNIVSYLGIHPCILTYPMQRRTLSISYQTWCHPHRSIDRSVRGGLERSIHLAKARNTTYLFGAVHCSFQDPNQMACRRFLAQKYSTALRSNLMLQTTTILFTKWSGRRAKVKVLGGVEPPLPGVPKSEPEVITTTL